VAGDLEVERERRQVMAQMREAIGVRVVGLGVDQRHARDRVVVKGQRRTFEPQDGVAPFGREQGGQHVVPTPALGPDLVDVAGDLDNAIRVEHVGEAGAAFHSMSWPAYNDMILTALPDSKAETVVAGLKAFRDQSMQRRGGEKIPLRVFSLPCELVV
jgi:hypothetical protein